MMSSQLYNRILDQLSQFGYRGDVGLFWFNEPLLDARLPQFIRDTRSACPDCYIYIASNGTLLQKPILQELTEAGLDKIVVQYPHRPPPEISKLKASRNKRGESIITAREIGEYVNRTGGPGQHAKKATLLCSRPDYQMVVDVNGRVVLCCNDYFGHSILGDSAEDSLLQIWNKPRLKQIRKQLRQGNRSRITPCNSCDAPTQICRWPKALAKKRAYFD